MATSSEEEQGGLSQDAIASLITQVSPTGQPARAPTRSARPRQGSKRAPARPTTVPASNTNTANVSSQVIPSTSPDQAPLHTLANSLAPGQSEKAMGDDENPTTNNTDYSLASTSETVAKARPGTASSSHAPSITPSTASAKKRQSGTATATASSSSPIGPAANSTESGLSSTRKTVSSDPMKPKKKRKSFIASLFSCFSSSSHENGDGESVMTERKNNQANIARSIPIQQPIKEKKETQPVNLNRDTTGNAGTVPSPSTNTAIQLDAANSAERNAIASENTARGRGDLPASQTANYESSVIPEPSSAPPSPKADIAPEVIAANSRTGATLPLDETEGILSGAVQAPGSEGLTPTKKSSRRKSSGEASSMGMGGGENGNDSRVSSVAGNADEVLEDSEDEYMDEDERIIAQGGAGIPMDEHGNPRPLLIELTPSNNGRKCLVLDLDETLVHSSFKLIPAPDFVVPVEIENQVHNVYVLKRPGVDAFMKRMGEIYEMVVFTASLSKYADPVLDCLDIHRVVKHRLFRESCYNHKGNYVKDLSQLGRPIGETIIIDNSPASYIFHPNNAVPVSSWFNDPHDTELTDLQHFLTDLAQVPDVRGVLDGGLYSTS